MQGLGKTVQAIGFVAAVLDKTGTEEDVHHPELHVRGSGIHVKALFSCV